MNGLYGTSLLERFPCVRTRDPEVALRALIQMYGDITIALGGDDRLFEWNANRVDLGPVSLVADTIHGEVSLCGEVQSYLLLFSREGRAWVTQSSHRAELRPAWCGALLSPTMRTTWQFDSRVGVPVRTLAVRIDRRFLEGQFEVLSGVRPRAQLDFALQLGIAEGAGASLDRLLGFLLDEIERGSEALSYPLVSIGLCESLVRGILYGQRHALSHILESQQRAVRISPRHVRLVEEYIEANLSEAIRMKDLVALTGVSSRSIQAAFRAHRGSSPMAFVKEKRLELAHRRLLAPGPGASVTTVAYGSGFMHLGQFSVDYFRRFGERPSATLRRGFLSTSSPLPAGKRGGGNRTG